MNESQPIELRKLYTELTHIVADVLEHPETPRELADALLEVVNPLEAVLTEDATAYQSCAANLRALAGLNESGHTMTRAEPEKSLVAATDAFLSASGDDSGESQTLDLVPLANVAAIH